MYTYGFVRVQCPQMLEVRSPRAEVTDEKLSHMDTRNLILVFQKELFTAELSLQPGKIHFFIQ